MFRLSLRLYGSKTDCWLLSKDIIYIYDYLLLFFILKENPPRVLSCGHTFCEEDVKLSKVCFLCQQPIEKVESETIDELYPKNTSVLNYIHLRPKPEKPKCAKCNEAHVQLFCAEDEAGLCENCWDSCHQLPRQKKHKKHKWSQFILSVHRSKNCVVHPERLADTVCLNAECPDLHSLMCSSCSEIGPHVGCPRKLLSSVAQPARVELASLMDQGTAARDAAEKSIR